MRTHAIVALMLAFASPAPAQEYAQQLQELLGGDYHGAKIVGLHNDRYIATVDLETLTVRETGPYKEERPFEGLSRPCWSPDGQLILFAHGGTCSLMEADGTRIRQILQKQPKVYEPNWWMDPVSGDLAISFTDRRSKNGLERGRYGNTLLSNLRTLQTHILFDIPCSTQLSRDGTHIGETYRDTAIIDLRNSIVHRPHAGQSCNGSLSPDNQYALMFLYLPHTHFGIKTRYGEELWRIRHPEGSEEWQSPRWSNHPDLCAAVAKYSDGYKLVVIRISTQQMVVLKNLEGDWQAPHLWVRSGIPGTGPTDAPSDFTTLEDARRLLAEASTNDNATAAEATYKKVFALFPNQPEGIQAGETLRSPRFARELEAKTLLDELWLLVDRIRPVQDDRATFDTPSFRTRNQALLVRMVGICAALREQFGETRAAALAAKVAGTYGLPDRTDLPQSSRVELIATIEETSRVPSAAQIAPYREAITYIRYRVDQVISGDYTDRRIVVVHWGMKDGQHTPAAGWARGTRQRLIVEDFDAHPELDRITRASGAEDRTRAPYWALEVHQE